MHICPAFKHLPHMMRRAATLTLASGATKVGLIEIWLVCPHEVEPWSHSWYRGRVETLDAKYNLIFRYLGSSLLTVSVAT